MGDRYKVRDGRPQLSKEPATTEKWGDLQVSIGLKLTILSDMLRRETYLLALNGHGAFRSYLYRLHAHSAVGHL